MFPYRQIRPLVPPRPSNGYRGRSFRKPCGSPPSSVLWVRKTARPHTCPPLVSLGDRVSALVSGEMASSPGFLGNPFGNMPRASDSGDFGPPFAIAVVPDTAFRHFNDVGIATIVISELNLHGLLPCCVRFAPTSRPANGNTRYRPAR